MQERQKNTALAKRIVAKKTELSAFLSAFLSLRNWSGMFLHVVPHCSCLQVVQVWSVEHIKDSELFAQLLSLRIALRIGGPETKLPLIMVNSYQAV